MRLYSRSLTGDPQMAQNKNSMRLLYRGLLVLIIVGSWGCERPPTELTPEELPIAKNYDSDHCGSPARLNIHVVASTNYVFGGQGFSTNAAGLSTILSRRHAKLGYFPLIIWAKKEAPFEDVWRLMELGVTNKHFKLAIQDGDKPKRTITTLHRSDRSLGYYEHYINCSHPLAMESSSNLVIVVCEKHRLTLDSSPCSIEDLELKLRRVKRFTTGYLQILILATGDCPYQQVINVLDACSREHFGYKYLGLQLPGAPLPELPSEEKNE
jgi:Biopolymer transport protein ExbD/TolR